MKKLVNLLNLLNGGAAATVGLTDTVTADPKLKVGLLLLNVLVAKFLPSAFGIGHKVFYGNDPETGVRLNKVLLVPLALMLSAGSAMAQSPSEVGKETDVEIVGSVSSDAAGDAVDAETIQDNPGSYALAITEPLGTLGRYALNVALERTAYDAGDSGIEGFDSYAIDALLRVRFGPPKILFHVAVGGGMEFTDRFLQEQNIELVLEEPAALNGGGGGGGEGEVIGATVVVEDSETLFRASLEAGFALKLTPDDRFGIGAAYVYRYPFGEEALDHRGQVRVFARIPIPGGA